MPILQLNQVCKTYAGGKNTLSIEALKNVDLVIRKKELCAVIGPSASGKSTLLHLIGALDRPSRGDIYFQGKNLSAMKDAELARYRNENVGFVLQHFALIESRTVFENVSIPLYFSNVSIRKMKACVMDVLEKVGMDKLANRKVFQLSGGQRQRVAIARALVRDPPIILADEPTGSLDSQSSNEILEVILKLNRHGKTVILVTHEPTIADACPRKLIMKDGNISTLCEGEN